MKILFFLGTLIMSIPSKAQMFASLETCQRTGSPVFTSLSGDYTMNRHNRTKMAVGIVLVSVGGTASLVGVIAYNFAEHQPVQYDYAALGIAAAGAAMAITGFALMASGRSGHFKRPYNRWNLLSPKQNEFGLAFNF